MTKRYFRGTKEGNVKVNEIHMEIITDKALVESGCNAATLLAARIWSVPNDIIPPGSPIIGVFYDLLRRRTEVYFSCERKKGVNSGK